MWYDSYVICDHHTCDEHWYVIWLICSVYVYGVVINIAMCCNVLQCDAGCCSVLHCVDVWKYTGSTSSLSLFFRSLSLFLLLFHINKLQHTSTNCNTIPINVTMMPLQHTSTHCNTHQHTATHINTLQHTSEQTSIWYRSRWHILNRQKERGITREGVRKESAGLAALSSQMSVCERRCVCVEIEGFFVCM